VEIRYPGSFDVIHSNFFISLGNRDVENIFIVSQLSYYYMTSVKILLILTI